MGRGLAPPSPSQAWRSGTREARVSFGTEGAGGSGMDKHQLTPTIGRGRASTLPQRFRDLLHGLLVHAGMGPPRLEFLRKATETLMEFSGCDAMEGRVSETGRIFLFQAAASGDGSYGVNCRAIRPDLLEPGSPPGAVPERILESVVRRSYAAAAPFLTRSGSFWTGDASRPILLRDEASGNSRAQTVVIGGEYPSLIVVPVPIDQRTTGVLSFMSRRRDAFDKEGISLYEAAGETLGVALAHQAAEWALRERVKELTCLYGIAKILQRPRVTTEELLKETAELLPPGWQYPDTTLARVTLDGRAYATASFPQGSRRLAADIVVEGVPRGTVEVAYSKEWPEEDEGPFLKEERNLLNAVAETLGVALGHREALWALGERVKELTCLYGIAKVARRPRISLSELMREVVALLPPGWQYPEITRARIVLDDEVYAGPDYREGPHLLSADLSVKGQKRGQVQVIYAEPCPEADEGAFLKEERSLLNEVARQVGLILEARETEEERIRLEEQVRHADRLATIGQLAAGAAHELNEPLGSILGFAQLAKDWPDLPQQPAQDLEKIISAALHAREVIRKLMVSARQVPTRKTSCNVNRLVQDGLFFIESRCSREGIELVRRLEDGLPDITADPSQIHQVLVNLVVNAVQAMPAGGTLTITTRSAGESVVLAVEDTGVGMDSDVLKQIFVPFFTTKEVGQGTGLGLSVVHGIVASHGGAIHVESQVGKGSRFEVTLPITVRDGDVVT